MTDEGVVLDLKIAEPEKWICGRHGETTQTMILTSDIGTDEEAVSVHCFLCYREFLDEKIGRMRKADD